MFSLCVLSFLSFIKSSTTLWEFLTSLYEPILLSNSSASLCESEWLFSCAHSPVPCLVTHSKPLDPPHYGQQIAVLTETHFDGSVCRLLRCFAWINTPASQVYWVMSLSWVCGITALWDSKQQRICCTSRVLKQNTWRSVFSHCSDRQENLWVFVLPKVSLLCLIPAVIQLFW